MSVVLCSALGYNLIMKFHDKITAIKLRKAGHSYSSILEELKVSKSTISLWLRNIKLTPKQKEKLLKGRQKSQYAGAKAQQRKRIERTKEIIINGKKEFNLLVKSPLFLSGLLLYWAEGDKNWRERVKFTNSDEAMIILMMRWFREICNAPEEKFRISLHVHDLHCNPSVKNYWSKLTKVPKKQFHKIYIKKSTLHQRRNILYNGTCAININNRDLFRKIIGWKLGMLEYFNISPRSSTDRMKDF